MPDGTSNLALTVVTFFFAGWVVAWSLVRWMTTLPRPEPKEDP